MQSSRQDSSRCRSWANFCQATAIWLSLVLGASIARADNTREIIGQWELQQIKAGVATAKIKADKPREFFKDGKVVDHGGKQQSGTFRFINDKVMEITLGGKTEKEEVRILNNSMVTTHFDGSMKVEMKWKRVK